MKVGTAIHSFVNGELQIWYTEKIFSGQGQITCFRILHPIVLLHKTINMSMCVCVFTDMAVLHNLQRDIMTLRNVMMSMVDIMERLYLMLYSIIILLLPHSDRGLVQRHGRKYRAI